MNKHVRKLFVAIQDNRVVHASTQYAEFYRTMSGLVTGMKSPSYYEKLFKDQDVVRHVDNIGKIYFFQKVK